MILNTIDGGIFALDASTGALRWTKSSGEAVARASPSFGYQDNAKADGESEAVGSQGAAGGKETVSSEGEDAGSSENKTYGSELFHQNSMDANWKFQQEEESDFDIIPLYAPGGGLLTVSNGVMEPFGLRANEIVDQSPFVDNGVVVVGSKSTKLYAIDPETGQTSWTHFDKVEDEQCNSANPDADTLIITRSEYSLKVRNAKTGAHSWNVSIAEFRAHGPHSKHDHFKGESICYLCVRTVTDTLSLQVFNFLCSSVAVEWVEKKFSVMTRGQESSCGFTASLLLRSVRMYGRCSMHWSCLFTRTRTS